ncbi:MAG: 50S ribosomal protein L11 methyltransferase [Vampirovibrionales bacterium]|nr:50S ribosomal protein L11 methyltransferase [Vampirovibrionales bacterium]
MSALTLDFNDQDACLRDDLPEALSALDVEAGQTFSQDFTATTSELASLIADFCWGFEGVTAAELRTESAEHITEARLVRVYALLPETLRGLQAWFAQSVWASQISAGPLNSIAEADWAEAWKQHWHIDHVTDKLTIVPAWESYIPKGSDETVITMDPGMAFGTGQHATTRLMLRALEALSEELGGFNQQRVLDIGTGSGVLAIYAAKQGCKSIIAIDIDPIAVHTTEQEAARNNVASVIEVSDTPLHALCQTQNEIVLANILAGVIIELLPEMVKRMAPGAILLASGITEGQADDVIAAMAANGLVYQQRLTQGAWVMLRARKP